MNFDLYPSVSSDATKPKNLRQVDLDPPPTNTNFDERDLVFFDK